MTKGGVSSEAVEAVARRVRWAVRSDKAARQLARLILRDAAPHLRASWKEELLGEEAVEAVAKLAYRYSGAGESLPPRLRPRWETESEATREEFHSEARELIEAALDSLSEQGEAS